MHKSQRKALKWIPLALILLLIIMFMTTPSRERFDNWVMEKRGINCEYDNYLGNVCDKDGIKTSSKSSHFVNAGIYASYDLNYKFENGHRETFRTLGVLGMLFQMKEGYLWEVLN